MRTGIGCNLQLHTYIKSCTLRFNVQGTRCPRNENHSFAAFGMVSYSLISRPPSTLQEEI